MKLEYTTTVSDYIEVLNQVLSKSMLSKRFSQFAWISISVLAWTSVIMPYFAFGEFGIGSWIRTIFATFLTVAFPYLYKWYNNSAFGGIINENSMARFAGPITVTLDEDGIRTKTQTVSSFAKWEDVTDLIVTDKHIFIFLTPLIITPIPLKLFSNQSEQEAVVNKIRNFLKK